MRPPIHQYAEKGQLEQLEQEIQRLKENGEDINAAWGDTGDTPLHSAVKARQPDSVNMLLQYKPDIYAVNSSDFSIAHTIMQKISDCLQQTPINIEKCKEYIDIFCALVGHELKHSPQPIKSLQNIKFLNKKHRGLTTPFEFLKTLLRKPQLAAYVTQKISEKCQTLLQPHQPNQPQASLVNQLYAFINNLCRGTSSHAYQPLSPSLSDKKIR